MNSNFQGITLDMIKNQMYNQDMDRRGRQCSHEVKKFVLTLNFYSPCAYEYIWGVFSLPHTNSLTEKISSVNYEPGFFVGIFRSLKARIDLNPTHKECSLLCGALSIKSSTHIIIIQLVFTMVVLIMVKVLLFLRRIPLLKKY